MAVASEYGMAVTVSITPISEMLNAIGAQATAASVNIAARNFCAWEEIVSRPRRDRAVATADTTMSAITPVTVTGVQLKGAALMGSAETAAGAIAKAHAPIASLRIASSRLRTAIGHSVGASGSPSSSSCAVSPDFAAVAM